MNISNQKTRSLKPAKIPENAQLPFITQGLSRSWSPKGQTGFKSRETSLWKSRILCETQCCRGVLSKKILEPDSVGSWGTPQGKVTPGHLSSGHPTGTIDRNRGWGEHIWLKRSLLPLVSHPDESLVTAPVQGFSAGCFTEALIAAVDSGGYRVLTAKGEAHLYSVQRTKNMISL